LTPTPRLTRWEIPAALVAAALTFVPVARIPAGVALICFLPGVALCRHRLGVASIPRALILGSVLSLCVLPAVVIRPRSSPAAPRIFSPSRSRPP